jgi:hypothetical protein
MSPRLCDLLVRLHARWWRARYGAEFGALLREVPATPRTVLDALWGAVVSRGSQLALAAGALVACVAIGYVNLGANEILPVLLLIFVANSIFIALQPRLVWLWVLLFGLSVEASYLIAEPLRIAAVDPPRHDYEALIAVVPSVVQGLLVLGLRGAVVALRRLG